MLVFWQIGRTYQTNDSFLAIFAAYSPDHMTGSYFFLDILSKVNLQRFELYWIKVKLGLLRPGALATRLLISKNLYIFSEFNEVSFCFHIFC